MRALILGSADCLWEDVGRLSFWGGLTIGINDAGPSWPHQLDHLVTCHPEYLHEWRETRESQRRNTGYTSWSRRRVKDKWKRSGRPVLEPDRTVDEWGRGASGLLAVTVALDHLNADEVVLCGCPMEARPHFLDHRMWGREPWRDVENHTAAWEDSLHRMKGRVFSMSGWTRELLGEPCMGP